MNTQEMELRGRAHTALRAELNRQGVLHAHERELLLDAADALLFEEPEAQQRLTEALELLDALQTTGRRTDGEAVRLRTALDGCGVTVDAVVAA
jgi:hypothetical protein